MNAESLVELGNACYRNGDVEGALRHYRAAIDADPGYGRAHYNLGVVEQRRGRPDEARRHYERVGPESPVFGLAQANLSVLELLRYNFARGWDAYEARIATGGVTLRSLDLPRLDIADLGTARSVAVCKEQGIGDQLLYSTLLPDLASRGVHAVVETDPRLVEAYRRSLAETEFVTPDEAAAAFARCDFQCALGSLPRLLRRSRESFASQPDALLFADPARVAETDAALAGARRIGVSWRSFQGPDRAHVTSVRSVPIEAFAALDVGGTTLVDLQYGDAGVDRAEFDARHPGLRSEVPGLDRFNDLEGVIAAIEACDLIVTPSNITAHLAGAIGKRTLLVYLAANPPFHYWVPGPGGRSLWYPSVEIVTDPSWERWEQVFTAVAERLRAERTG